MSCEATRVYTHSGLRVRSDIELGLPVAAGATWDVDVRRGTTLTDATGPPPGHVIAACEDEGVTWYTATATDDGYRLRFFDCCDFVVSRDLDEIEVRSAPTERSGMVPVLLAGTVLAFVLSLRGATVLHASAVAIGGRAVAFAGCSGQGKTTLAALLCVEGGATLVTDDVLAVDAGPPVTGIGGSHELRLRPAAVPLLTGATGLATRSTFDERLAVTAPGLAAGRVPLAAIVVPEPSRVVEHLRMERLGAIDAVRALLSFPRIFGWREPAVLRRDLAVFGQVADRVPVYAATIPWGPPFAPDVVSALAALAGDR